MLTQKQPDPEYRYAQGRKEDQEDYPGRRGELLVAGRSAGGQASAPRTCRGWWPRCRDSGPRGTPLATVPLPDCCLVIDCHQGESVDVC